MLYNGNIPEYIQIEDGSLDVPEIDKKILGENIIIKENLKKNIKQLEKSMINYIYLEENVNVNNLNQLCQPRGNMVEISNIQSKRLYKKFK